MRKAKGMEKRAKRERTRRVAEPGTMTAKARTRKAKGMEKGTEKRATRTEKRERRQGTGRRPAGTRRKGRRARGRRTAT